MILSALIRPAFHTVSATAASATRVGRCYGQRSTDAADCRGRELGVLVWLLACVTCLFSDQADADVGPEPSSQVRLQSVRLGFQGLTKIGAWAPVEATVEVEQDCELELVVVASDPNGCRVRYHFEPVPVPAGKQSVLRGRVRSGRPTTPIDVQLLAQGEQLAAQTLRVGSADFPEPERQSTQVVLLSGPGSGFEELPDVLGQGQSEDAETGPEMQVVSLENLSQLPRDGLDYEAVDVLVIAGRYRLEPDQNAALQSWVQRGGRLIVLVGEGYKEFRESRLAEWLPVQVDELTVTVRELSSLEALAGPSGTRLRFNGSLEVPVLQPRDGRILAESIDTPLVVRAAYGTGQVTVVGLDFDGQPLATWDSRTAVCARLIDAQVVAAESSTEQSGNRLSSSGVTDILTQLQGALQDFQSIRRLPTWGVMGLVFAYLLVIGPLDYLLVHRILKRPELTWVTFPVTVVLVSGLAVATARSQNGDEVQVNQIEMIDLDQSDRVCTVRAWSTIYSPAAKRYALTAESELHDRLGGSNASRPVLGWLGIPEASYGGMYREGGLEVSQPQYAIELDSASVPNLPMKLWSTRSLDSRFGFTIERPPVEGNLENRGLGQLAGQVWHNLPFAVEDWILAYDTRVYLPDEPLTPGLPFPAATWDNVSQRDLRSFLTDTRTRQIESRVGRGVEFRTEQGVYDITSRDAGEILRILTFFEAAGGRGYTRLQNHVLRECDLSHLLKLDRAVVFGRVDYSALELSVDDTAQPDIQRETYIRISLPVKAVRGELEELPVFD